MCLNRVTLFDHHWYECYYWGTWDKVGSVGKDFRRFGSTVSYLGFGERVWAQHKSGTLGGKRGQREDGVCFTLGSMIFF